MVASPCSSGRWCYGKTLLATFLASVPLAHEKRRAA
jgi:hypothetical protein